MTAIPKEVVECLICGRSNENHIYDKIWYEDCNGVFEHHYGEEYRVYCPKCLEFGPHILSAKIVEPYAIED